MPTAYPSSAHNPSVKVNFRRGSIWIDKDGYKARAFNPSAGIDRMDDYQAMHHEISDAQCISFVCTQ